MTSPPQNQPEKAPDPATSYERAKPAEESPSGKLDQAPAPDPHEHDHLQDQNPDPKAHPRGGNDPQKKK